MPIKTSCTIDGREVGYVITNDGYDIYLGNRKWISQHEPYIPYPQLGYEGSCLKQIEDLCNPPAPPESTMEERITSLEDMIIEMSEIIYA